MAIDGKEIQVDFLIDENNNIYINEINTLPGSITFIFGKIRLSF